MIYGYIRVSTDKQTTENQKYEIDKFAANKNIKIDRWIMETISSTKELEKRKLGKLLKKLNKDDIIIASELSRLGRNLMQVMSILHSCMNKETKVWTIKDNYRLGSDIQSKVLAFAFGLSAEIERNLISQRTKEALARLKSEGRTLGRPKGSLTAKPLLHNQQGRIRSLVEKQVPRFQMAKILGVNKKTVYRYLKKNAEDAELLKNAELTANIKN